MNKFITIIISLCLLFSILTGGVSEKPPAAETGREITIIDYTGRYVEVPAPVERIVSLNSGMSTLICAFGDGDKIVGRDERSSFPSSLKDVFVVGGSAHSPNIELILEKRPDVVVSDQMLKDDMREKLEAAGIPVLIDSTSNTDRIIPAIKNFGLLLDKKEKADEITSFIEHYCSIVARRIAELEPGEEPLVFFQWQSLYKSASGKTVFHKPMVAAGGINIAASEPVLYPKLSAEWVLQKNPDVIVYRISGDETPGEMKELRQEIMSQPGLEDVNAVKNGRVHITKADAFLTLRYPVGLLYYARWFHPDLFNDIDPAAVHQELIEKFFGPEEWQKLNETFAFPEP
ncbi:ABC transporter substrate-binding protein [Chloroflexota bacterium]